MDSENNKENNSLDSRLKEPKIIEAIKKVNEEIKAPIPSAKYFIKSKRFNQYLTMLFTFLFVFGSIIFIFFMWRKLNLVFVVLWFALLFPMFILFFIVTLWRILKDKNLIKAKFIKAVSSNFIILNFYLPQRRRIRRVCILEGDGISAKLGKCTYIVDKEAIWINEDNHPECDYIPNLPNSLKYDIEKKLKQYAIAFNDGELDKFNTENDLVDVSFSSENLQEFKKSKIFADLNKQDMPEMTKIAMMLLALCGFLVLTIILTLIFAR